MLTTEEKNDVTLPENHEGEGEMARVRCVGPVCGRTWDLTFKAMYTRANETIDVLSGTIECHDCQSRSPFTLTQDAASAPSLTYGALEQVVEGLMRNSAEEAELCFFGGAYRACVAMGRAALEDLLHDKGIGKENDGLDARVKEAGNWLSDEQVSQITMARLIGREALHRRRLVSQLEGLTALATTFHLLNDLAPKPKPAS